ncbi:MAG: hypothetical protein PHT32_05680 [Candidatus Omnitrophica bacterium]|nr:hypothetical protein [Candidatus Omnitrophota bacterium]
MAIAYIEESKELKRKLKEELKIIINISPDSLSRVDELGINLSFSECKPIFEMVLKLFGNLNACDLNQIPRDKLKKLIPITNSAIQLFMQIKNFDPRITNPFQSRDDLINQLCSQYNSSYFPEIVPVVTYASMESNNISKLHAAAKAVIDKLQDDAVGFKKIADKEVKEIKDTVDKVRNAAAETGVTVHSSHFEKEANEQKKASSIWLWAVIALVVITAGFGRWCLVYYLNNMEKMSIPQALQLAAAKLIIFSLLLTSLVWVGRIYKAHRHNYVINRHRQNALKTFEAFVKAANDDQTKSAVLLQATQCIFSPQPTGYITHESEPSGSPQILEIIRNMANPNSK